MSIPQTKIINGQIITPNGILKNGSLLISGGRITEISESGIDSSASVILDAAGKFVSPGFIDIHVHGGGGSDFMDGTVDAFLKIAELHARYGTTSLVPTTLTAEKEDLLHTLDIYRQAYKKNNRGAQFMGMHIEGPYFDMEQRGAQDPRYIRHPDEKEYREVIARAGDIIVRWSAAPELPGAIEFGRYMKSKGILPAIAHTNAVYDDVLKALENGYTLATHFYSGMSGVMRRNAFRYAGVIESVYLLDEIDVEIIADGVHLPAPLLKLIHKIKGTRRIALITDAMRAAGMPPGESILGSKQNGLKVIVEDGVAKLPDRSSFAGSVATADRLVRTMRQLTGLSLTECVRMITETPARIMRINQKGSLAPGKDGDVVVFDEDINIQTTIVNGTVIYQKLG
ncbi:MAG: N-acetylglucosamine-6-phosphate deacetylase [Bacteroidota bacterium]|nr:N-acetylglucosamine-6-phosphate deacetylase [Bacteroidota bacterium]MDP4211023.1 N-acetylglucosamine-6-phosphate deacetylase [Bacteroidota bacterium]MDP4248755.1 N-acetylglucosamine-6-phosphate deacetylase [Bacteroidota bacterium]